jgi:iron-sulfur cluster assembly accessory protein
MIMLNADHGGTIILTLTDAAREKIRELGSRLRIDLAPGGCCGTIFTFKLDAQDDDLVLRFDEISVQISAQAQGVLVGSRLDYGYRLKPPKFRILNISKTIFRCACNRSFGTLFPGKATPQCQDYVPMIWED